MREILKFMSKRKDAKQFSVSFPKHLIEEIDIICKTNYTTRSSWLISAARNMLELERLKKIEKLQSVIKAEAKMT